MPSVHGGAIVASVIPSAPLGTDAAEDRFAPRAATGHHPGTAAERRFRFELAAHPGSVAQARRLTRSRLSGWAVCEDTCDTATLVVSELVTNAIVHAAGQRVVCELQDTDDLVRIAVCDEGCAPGEPHPSPQRPDEEHGRGLLLVAAVSRAWGAQDTGPGLLVWAELTRSAGRADDTTDTTRETWPDPGDMDDLQDMDERADPDDLDRLDIEFEAGSNAGLPGRPREARSNPGRTDVDTGPRADLGWSAKKPPNDGRGTGAEGCWGAGTVGVRQDSSARSVDRDRDRDRDRGSL
ncbi:ATP-binding protein [Streptomyces sp. NPDC002935]|uniref:ATP-binding protein n=1 Tax=Streptomyces sp. NPDC002935 TaxID=3154545 RepID=UPI0033BD7FDB